MGSKATARKNKYNNKTYKQFTARLKPELYNNITEFCKKNQLSYSKFLEKALDILKTE
ncbi:hypothetical protein [uncultured Tyzzerella sp.]|uniref:hypothetical protein n=1 Tax=uncultured Tyzzerella sp. TaxID=2321398 RepID=UPI002942DA1C|nr:hypothetical protein [uncultured Tyzzerella sp.]